MFIFSSSDNSLLRLLLLTIALLAVTSSTRALPVKGVTSVELNARGAAQSRPQQCPSIKDIEAHIKAKSGGLVKNAVYWSYPGSIKRAEAFVARDRGDRHYIYDFVKNEDIARWGNLCPPEQGNLLWARASYAFAKLSKGSAYVVTGQGNPEDSIWQKYEFQVLKATGQVNSVFSLDPVSLAPTMIWSRNKKVENFPKEP